MTVDQDLERFLPLGPHQFHILMVLLDQDLHGYGILKEVSRRTDGDVRLGTSTLYSALERLVKHGFLQEAGGAGLEAGKGPPRKVFRITDAGRHLARAEAFRIQRLNRAAAESGLLEAPAIPGSGEGGS